MPPQVQKSGPGGPVVQQAPPPEVPKDESKDVAKSTSSADTSAVKTQTAETKSGTSTQQKEPEDPKAAARQAQGSKQNAIAKEKEHKYQAQMIKNDLQKKIPAAKTGTAYTAADFAADAAKAGLAEYKQKEAPPSADASGLKKGESISAKVNDKPDGIHFEFERPITKDQAGAIIFQDGKVPDHAKLEGSGKDWTVKIPNSSEAKGKTITHFNKREETIKIPDRNPNAVYQADTQITNTWTGGDLKTAGPRTTEPQRRDLKNDMGFTINNKYELDQGQRHREKLGLPGMGYEVGFEKPMTKDQVMNKLFDKEKLNGNGREMRGEIRLIPKSKEPASEWNVELVGVDAAGAFKTDPGRAYSDVGRAFSDANASGKKSLPSNTPAGIRAHIENRTIPADAVKHGKDVYVWEQDGHMMHVKTNNKGKDGYYEAQAPTKMPSDKSGQIWMRYYMKEKGMAPSEAWQTFKNDTDEIAKMQVGMVGGAVRPVFGNARVATPRVSPGRTVRANMKSQAPHVNPELQRMTTYNSPQGKVKISVGEYRQRVKQAEEWLHAQRVNSGKTMEKGKQYFHGPTEQESRAAAEKFGLDEGWARIGNSNRGRLSYGAATNREGLLIPPKN